MSPDGICHGNPIAPCNSVCRFAVGPNRSLSVAASPAYSALVDLVFFAEYAAGPDLLR